LDYSGDSLGYMPLRRAIAAYLKRSRAVKCEAEQLAIVSGSQQGIDLIARLLVDPGDAVAIENPGYRGAHQVFLAAGAELCPVPVDECGLLTELLWSGSLPPVKIVYVTPSHQFPTGGILSSTRRQDLITWAGKTGSVVIEDDYDSEYRYGARPMPALQGMDASGSVIYIGTLSKMLFPSLR